jgi:cytochrome c oxidase cbb3-type subunit I/II
MSPQKMVAESIMPPYPWIIDNVLNTSNTAGKIRAMMKLGVPYPEGFDTKALDHLQKQANQIAQGLRDGGIDVEDQKEVIALIAYIQRLGTDIHRESNKSIFSEN